MVSRRARSLFGAQLSDPVIVWRADGDRWRSAVAAAVSFVRYPAAEFLLLFRPAANEAGQQIVQDMRFGAGTMARATDEAELYAVLRFAVSRL